MDAAEYKHVVLGLIFLKYVSDSFDEFREELKEQFNNPDHEFYVDGAKSDEVKNMKHKNLAVEMLSRLLKGQVKTKTATNLVQAKKYSELLAKALLKYRNRSIETAQVIEELIQMAKDFNEELKRGENLGLNNDELAFYDALINNESAVRELGDEVLKTIAHELTDQLRKTVTVDWSKRESVRAGIRIKIKRLLKKYKYPPEDTEAAIIMILEQAETISEKWVS